MEHGHPSRSTACIRGLLAAALLCGGLMLGGCSGRTSSGDTGDGSSTADVADLSTSTPADAQECGAGYSDGLSVSLSDDAYRPVTPDQARDLMENGDLIVVDVRTASEYASGHLRGAINVPLDTITQAASAADLTALPDPSRSLMVYCRTGVRSRQAADALIALGYTRVYDLQGGITAWTGETTGGGDSCTAPR